MFGFGSLVVRHLFGGAYDNYWYGDESRLVPFLGCLPLVVVVFPMMLVKSTRQ